MKNLNHEFARMNTNKTPLFVHIRVHSWFILSLLAAVGATAQTPAQAYEAAAKELKFLAAGDLLHGRLPRRVTPLADQESHNRIVTELFSRDDSIGQLTALLTHDNPKVRTLAVAALVWRNEARALPEIARLLDDDAETFPHPALVAMIPGQIEAATPLEPQKVRDFPRVVLRIYMEQAGQHDVRKFDQYWSGRKDRAVCAGWLAVEADKVGRHAERKDALRAKVTRLPENDRHWTLLYIGTLDKPLFTEDELLAAAKTLGPDALLSTVAGKCPSDDPDLNEGGETNPAVGRIRLFVLRNARQLLRVIDAEALLKLGRSAENRSPWYWIAAAHLTPAQARPILEEAFAKFPGEGYVDAWPRADLAIATWRLEGLDASARLVEWFYGETLKHEGVPHSRCMFLQAQDPKSPASRQMVVKIVEDPRFAGLDWSSLKSLIPLVNAFAGREVISDAEVRSVQHPYGEQHVVQFPDQAMKTFPQQTQKLNDDLAGWRKRIQASVVEWNKP